MPDILRDRQYYKMLSREEQLDIAYREGNELAIAALEPRRAYINYAAEVAKRDRVSKRR